MDPIDKAILKSKDSLKRLDWLIESLAKRAALTGQCKDLAAYLRARIARPK